MTDTATPARFYVYDRKIGDLTRSSAVTPRYWVIDRTTGLMVDEYASKRAAEMEARDLNLEDAPTPVRRMPTFAESRAQAYALLGDAADEIRMGDWPGVSAKQRDAIRDALRCIGEAKDALSRASRT